jgi:carboxymethylenebutenolidase
MDIKTEYVTLSASDGTSLRAYVARPAGKPRGGLMVFQEIFGVNSHIRSVTERFGREGFLAIAPELFHRSTPGFESGYTDMGPGFAEMGKVTDAGLEADIRASFDWLRGQGESKICSTGYCMGGRVSTLAAITVPLACGVSYYGGGIAPSQFNPGLIGRLKDLQAPMLFFWGGLDTHIPADSVQAVTGAVKAAGKPYTNVEFSFADHGFFCDARASYNPTAAALAWPLTIAFMDTHITGQTRNAGA